MTNPIHSFHRTPVRLITIEEGGQRIDNFLFTELKDIPKSHLYQLLRKGEIRVNKKRVKPDYRLQTKDSIRLPPLHLPKRVEKKAPSSLIERVSEHILYEDNYFIVVNKPGGIAVHGGSGVSFGVIEVLRQSRPKEKYLELAHRLDRETSGCLLIVKKPSILKEVHQLLREGNVDKHYSALLKGKVPFTKTKKVDAPLRKYETKGGERMVQSREDGKQAVTYFTVLKRFPDVTLVEAKPLTGRTHQIRVHAVLLGHPIVGDEKYGDKTFNKLMQKRGLKRLFLHASSLAFTLPSNQKHYQFNAPLAPDLESLQLG